MESSRICGLCPPALGELATHSGSPHPHARSTFTAHTRTTHTLKVSRIIKSWERPQRLIASGRDAALLRQRVAKLPRPSQFPLLRCTDGPMTRPLAQLQVEEQHRGQRSSIIKERHLRTVPSQAHMRQVGYSWQAIKGERGSRPTFSAFFTPGCLVTSVAGRLRSASIGCERDCPSLVGSPRWPSAEAAGGAAAPNAGGLIMPSASDAVARAARLQPCGGSGSCDASLTADAAGPHLEQVASRASIDALSDELLRGWPKVRARVPPGVAGEPATAAAGRACPEGASMPSCTVSLLEFAAPRKHGGK